MMSKPHRKRRLPRHNLVLAEEEIIPDLPVEGVEVVSTTYRSSSLGGLSRSLEILSGIKHDQPSSGTPLDSAPHNDDYFMIYDRSDEQDTEQDMVDEEVRHKKSKKSVCSFL